MLPADVDTTSRGSANEPAQDIEVSLACTVCSETRLAHPGLLERASDLAHVYP
jgi:hypothetical protein